MFGGRGDKGKIQGKVMGERWRRKEKEQGYGEDKNKSKRETWQSGRQRRKAVDIRL